MLAEIPLYFGCVFNEKSLRPAAHKSLDDITVYKRIILKHETRREIFQRDDTTPTNPTYTEIAIRDELCLVRNDIDVLFMAKIVPLKHLHGRAT